MPSSCLSLHLAPDPWVMTPPDLPDTESPLPENPAPVSRARLWAHVLLIVPLPVIIGILGADRHANHKTALTENWRGLLYVSGVELGIFALFFGLAVWLSKSTRDDLLLRFRHPFRSVFLGLGYSVAIRLTLGIVVVVIGTLLVASNLTSLEKLQSFTTANRPEVETVVSIKALKNDPVYYWLMVTFVSFVVAGLREELWRTAALTGLRRLWPSWFGGPTGQVAALVLTSVLFGLAHAPMGVLAVAFTTGIGLLLGAIMIGHRSIWPAVIAHGAFDATSFAMIAMMGDLLKVMH